MFEILDPQIYFFAAIGLLFVIVIMICAFRMLIEGTRTFIVPLFWPPKLKDYGEWALVTGSTDGIGKAFARELARRGMNIVLVSRNLEKLKQVAEDLEIEFNINVEVVRADFTQGWDLYHFLRQELGKKEISILVNNVGILGSQPCLFLSMSEREMLDMINVNITSAVLVTSIVLPDMLKRKRGVTVTISSLVSQVVLPVLSCYGACKAFTNTFSLGLGYEGFPGIDFQALIPSYVKTKLNNDEKRWSSFYNVFLWKVCVFLGLRLFGTNVNSYAKSAINTLGTTMHTTGYLWHYLHIAMYWLAHFIMRAIFSIF